MAAFVKLSTRSPKDSSLLSGRAAALSGRDAQCEGAPMRVQSGGEALALLATSERVRADVMEALRLAKHQSSRKSVVGGEAGGGHGANESGGGGDGDGNKDNDSATQSSGNGMSLVVREWWHLPRWTEMRGFVRRATAGEGVRRLTALSRYIVDESDDDDNDDDDAAAAAADDDDNADDRDGKKKKKRQAHGLLEANAESVRAAVAAFVEQRLDGVLAAAGLDHAVVDFALKAAPNGACVLDVATGSSCEGSNGGDEMDFNNDNDDDGSEDDDAKEQQSSQRRQRQRRHQLRFDVVVLELNSFGFRSNGALFDWRDEQDAVVLFEGSQGGALLPPFRTQAQKQKAE